MPYSEGKKDMKEILDIYSKAAAPGDAHKLLAKLEGSWTTTAREWREPGKAPAESTGSCEQRLILGGRFLRQEYSADLKGSSFSGLNILGYNNHTKKYESVWIESMSTGVYYSQGSASADGKTITQSCSYDDPVRGSCILRSVCHIKDDNTLEYEMFITPQGGKEEKMMEMTVLRKAAVSRKAA